MDGPSCLIQTWVPLGGLRAAPPPHPVPAPGALTHTPTPLLLCQEPQQQQTLGEGGTQVAQDPAARATNPTNHQGKGSPGCSGEDLGVTLSLEGHRGLGWVQPDLGRAGPQARWGQSLCCCKTWAGSSENPTSSGPLRVLEWQSHILVPGKLLPSLSGNTHCQQGHLHGGTPPWGDILPLSSTLTQIPRDNSPLPGEGGQSVRKDLESRCDYWEAGEPN